MANVVEVLEHWAAGRSVRAIAQSLGLDRNTVRKYIAPARDAGFRPASAAPPEGWAAFVARVCPTLGTARNNGLAWAELAARHGEIAEALKVNIGSPGWSPATQALSVSTSWFVWVSKCSCKAQLLFALLTFA